MALPGFSKHVQVHSSPTQNPHLCDFNLTSSGLLPPTHTQCHRLGVALAHLAAEPRGYPPSSCKLRPGVSRAGIEHYVNSYAFVTQTVTAMLYPLTRGRPRLIRLPVHVHEDPTFRPWCEDVQLGRWFPFGPRYRRVDIIAGTAFSLVNDYTIVTTQFESGCPSNGTIRDEMGLFVRGNVVVLRHSARQHLRVCSVSRAEMRLIDLVVQRHFRFRLGDFL
ncbi:hypothetical protein C8Q76DRAFT_794499 [Earliella scabrosa]|nr:hypothetical protein C8Q76DRAFT_794499 [Earliella scabrosa]